MTKIDIGSDLHSDFYNKRLDWERFAPGADAILVCGDSANSPEEAADVLNHIAQFYPLVVAEDGNHEHYQNASRGLDTDDALALLKSRVASNVKILGTSAPSFMGASTLETLVVVGDIVIIGANGWYSFDADGRVPEANIDFWRNYMADERCIGFLGRQPLPYDLALRDADHIDAQLEYLDMLHPGKRAVVMTHTAPCRETLMWLPHDPAWDRSNGFFMNSHMTPIIEKHASKIALWAHGHTHFPNDRTVAGVRIVCNPHGYPHEAEGRDWAPVRVEI